MSNIVTMKQVYLFKPFDKVLMKRYAEDDCWTPEFFSDYGDNEWPYIAIGGSKYAYCIPYEGNERLVGTIELSAAEGIE